MTDLDLYAAAMLSACKLLTCIDSTDAMLPATLSLQRNCVQEGQKAIFHLEAFVARFMSDYKTWTIQAFG